VRSGVPTGYGARVPGWEVGDKGKEIQRSRDHGATVPSTPVSSSASISLRTWKQLITSQGRGMEETVAKRDETRMMRAGHQLRAIEGQCIYTIREMTASI